MIVTIVMITLTAEHTIVGGGLNASKLPLQPSQNQKNAIRGSGDLTAFPGLGFARFREPCRSAVSGLLDAPGNMRTTSRVARSQHTLAVIHLKWLTPKQNYAQSPEP